MTELLPGTAEEYREAVRFYKTVGMLAVNQREAAFAARAVEALKYAALRKTNQRLTVEQLKECHGLIVYGRNPYTMKIGAGFVDTHRGGVVMLDHDGTWCDTWDWGDPTVYRFPPDGEDIFPEAEVCKCNR
ncbi:hypothetical protein [Lawsonibacter sp. JLR.KK007]|uniref:hypothetical protein n=1 Tax=Lawsonibacter sp. JLR.KK007 TaxID=3114293 RepID=UPI002FEF6709